MGVNNRTGSYEPISQIKTIFDWREKGAFQAYLYNADYTFNLEFVSRKYVSGDTAELTRYLICKAICLRDVEALDYLVNEKEGEKIRFYTLLQLLNLFHGVYVLDSIATNSDFWSRIDGGQIDDKTFLSFHVFNYAFHIGKKLPNETEQGSSNISNVLSLSFSSDFYEESKISETKVFMGMFVSKLVSIAESNVFDEQFLQFYREFEPIAKDREINETGLELLEYLSESVAQGWAGERQLAVGKIECLIEE